MNYITRFSTIVIRSDARLLNSHVATGELDAFSGLYIASSPLGARDQAALPSRRGSCSQRESSCRKHQVQLSLCEQIRSSLLDADVGPAALDSEREAGRMLGRCRLVAEQEWRALSSLSAPPERS